MNKVQSVDNLYSNIAKTAVAAKESSEMHGLQMEDFYHTLTPKDGKEAKNRSSLTPNSKTDTSYRDSESLGFALSERKKAHQLKQLKLK